jgi:hypothetical protein
MQYDSAISKAEFQSFLTDTNLSTSTTAAISTLLNLETADTVNLASWDGVNAPEVPTGQTAPADVVTGEIAGQAGDLVTLDIPESLSTAKAFILGSDASLNVTFDAPVAAAAFALAANATAAADASTGIEFLVSTGAGNDVINVKGDQNSYIDVGDGNDTVITGNGNNTVVAGAGNNNIATGSGNDTIILSGVNHTDVVNTGAGYDVVQLDGVRTDYDFTTGNSYNVQLTAPTGAGQTAAITDAEFLTFVDADDNISTVALAHNETEAAALRLFEGVLGRDADATGAQSYTAQVNAGVSLTEVASAFLNSAEYSAAANTSFVSGLYSDLLGRDVGEDTAGLQSWLSVLANGGSKVDVVAGIATSQEAISQDTSNGTYVESLYDLALGRDSDEAGLNSWVTQLVNGASRAEVAAGILGSSEAAAKSTDDFITNLYVNALGRTEAQADADVAGKAGWVEALANGATQADVAVGIVGSQEAIAHIDNVVVLHGAV